MGPLVVKAIRNPAKILPALKWRAYHGTDILLRRLKASLFVRKRVIGNEVFFEYRGKRYPEYLHRGNALSFIQDKAKEYCRGRGIDIGPNRWVFPGAIPVREESEENAYRLDRFPEESLDYVLSSHSLEHLEDWKGALRLWMSRLKPGGVLFLYLPHPEQELWHPGAPWVGWGHKWIPEPGPIKDFLIEQGMRIKEISTKPDRYWSFHIVGEKRNGKI